MDRTAPLRTAARRAAAEPRTMRGLLAGSASLLFPGIGQLAVGAWRRGAVMLGVTVLFLLATLSGASPSETVVEALTRPGGLTELLLGNAALAVFRVYATLDAFRLGAGGFGRSTADQPVSRGSVVAVAALASLALVPHALGAHYTLLADGAFGAMFAPPEGGEAGSEDATGAATDGHAADSDPSSDEPSGLDADDTELSWLDDDERLTVAVLGSDAAPSRPGHRLDAMMVISVEPATGRVAVFSVERHLRGFPLPDGLQEPWEARCRDAAPGWDLLNSVYRCADEVLVDEVAARYPGTADPAAAAVADTLGVMLGVSVDHYAMVDMAGFVEVVDALGGIEVDRSAPSVGGIEVDRSAPSVADRQTGTQGCDWAAFDVQPESRHLDGRAALELVRNRDDTFESDRMARQRCLLMTLADQVDRPTLVRRFGELAGALRRNVVTSIPLNEVPALIELLGRVDADTAVTVGFGQPDYILAGDQPHLDRIRDDVATILDGSSTTSAMSPAVR